MRKLLATLLIFQQTAFAGLPPTTMQGQTDTSAKVKFQVQAPHNQVTDLGGVKGLIETGNSNILPNPGFEASTVGWTASGGATATANSTAKGTGAQGYDWDSNSASQTLVSATIVIPNGMLSNNGLLSCAIKTVSGTATHTMTVDDGTNNIVSPVTITSSTNGFVRTSVNFIYPSSGSIRVKFTSVAANEPEIYIDDCFLGDAVNIGTVAQAKLIGTVKITGCAGQWGNASTTFANFATQASCSYAVTGEALAPTTNVPGIRFASLAPGEYKIEYEGSFATPQNFDMFLRFSDGTNVTREESNAGDYSGTNTRYQFPNFSGSIGYTSPQSNVTFQVQAKVTAGTGYIRGTTAYPGVIRVYYYPSSSQQAIAMQNADYDWTSYTPTLNGFTASAIDCMHSRVSTQLRVKCKITKATHSAAEMRVGFPSGLTSADSTKIATIQVAPNSHGLISNANTVANAYLYPVLVEPSVTYFTFGIQGTGNQGLVKQNANNVYGATDIINFYAEVPISTWSVNQRAPILVGSVTSNSSGALRIEYLKILATCTSSPCTIAEQSGSWATSVTRSGTGQYTVNFPVGTFSTAPTCTATTQQTNNGQLIMINTTTTTTVPIVSQVGGGISDTSFYLICIGPR